MKNQRITKRTYAPRTAGQAAHRRGTVAVCPTTAAATQSRGVASGGIRAVSSPSCRRRATCCAASTRSCSSGSSSARSIDGALVGAALRAARAARRAAGHRQVDARRRDLPPHRGRALLPVAAHPLHHARGAVRRGEPARPSRRTSTGASPPTSCPRRTSPSSTRSSRRSSSILNTILTLMQRAPLPQRPRGRRRCRCVTLFAATNELPEDDELLALSDRFLLRFVVDYIGEDFRFLKLLQGRRRTARGTTLPLAALDAGPRRGRGAAGAGPGAARHRRPAARARAEEHHRLRPPLGAGARRAARPRLARRAATRSARTTCRSSSTSSGAIPAERAQICAAPSASCSLGYEDEIRVLLYQSRELREYALRPWDTGELRDRAPALEAHTKIRNILARVDAHPVAGARAAGGRSAASRRCARRSPPSSRRWAHGCEAAAPTRRDEGRRARSSSRRASTAGSRATPTTAAPSRRWSRTRRR